ncbi:MAG TPA: L-2-amino-thiazoline-4-carboxylic acid hydrolase [Planctomycetota bacterium]|nr:L-2-amino-thiazoline-4-carboxylic acid hydrolase [Planctomycetota bacterium]
MLATETTAGAATAGRVPGTSAVPATRVPEIHPRLLGALAGCAARARLSTAGLLLRVALRTAAMGGRLLRGQSPFRLRLKFLPLAALNRVLTARLDPAALRASMEMVLRTAAAVETARQFRPVMADPRVAIIAAQYRKVHRGAGRYQKVRYERDEPGCFQFAVTDCAFLRVLRELEIGELATAMCEADVCFWTRVVAGRGIRFSKNEQTIARGGDCCRSTFAEEE